MRSIKNSTFNPILVLALLLALVSAAIPGGAVSAGTDSLISALVLNEAEATALGLELKSFDDTSSSSRHVEARYIDPYPSAYDEYFKAIFFDVTLEPYRGSPSDAPDVIYQDKIYGCSQCLDPDCQQREYTGGQLVPRRPCYKPYRNGYTDYGQLQGETVFAQGDLLVKIESSTSYGLSGSGDKALRLHQLARDRHDWFVEQMAKKITADYLDVMQLTAYAYIAKQTNDQAAYFGQDMVYLEGTVTGPNGGLADVRLEGFYYSASGSGWNYALKTDSTGAFKGAIQRADQVAWLSVKARHTNTSPAYAGTDTYIIRDFSGKPAQTDAGMSIDVATDKKVYSAGDTVIIQGSVSDAQGGLAGADVVVNIGGKQLSATTGSSGSYRCEFPVTADIPQGAYTVSVTASYTGYKSTNGSTGFSVGEIGLKLEMNPVTGKPFIGVAADGVSFVDVAISLPGCSDVQFIQPAAGQLEGNAIDDGGNVTLDSSGGAEVSYYPPDYLTKDELARSVDVHKSGPRAWTAPVPLTLTYTDAGGQQGQATTEVLVCRPPVMLVHGFLGATGTWGKMSSYLQGDKFDTYLGDYGATDQSIEGLSMILKNDIRKQKTEYADANIKLGKVDIVGHSMGGLISRHYSHGLAGYGNDVRKLIMVGTPNHGVSSIKKLTGNLGAAWYQTHRIPAEQLYEESPFMLALNRGEKTGAHLNPALQYGNIYGFPDDWVVNSASAYLNGVAYITMSDVKHSPDIPGVPHVAITEYLNTWQQVNRWLTEDIWRPQLAGSHVEVFKYWGDVFLTEYDASGGHESKLTSSPRVCEFYQSLRTGPDSKAVVHLKINDLPWGVIFLDPDSEIFLGNCSPQLVEIRLWKGSAAFRSKVDGHFTVPVNIQRSENGEWWRYIPGAVVTGLRTEFAVKAGENIEVHCLEGELAVDTTNNPQGGASLSAGNSVAVTGEMVTTINPAYGNDFWWSTEGDDFLESAPGGNQDSTPGGNRDSTPGNSLDAVKEMIKERLSSCCIITVAYGSETAEELDILRAFRDEVMQSNPLGCLCVDAYYACSPPIAEFLAEHEEIRTLVREALLDPVVITLNNSQALWRN